MSGDGPLARWVDDDEALADVVDTLADESAYAVDTEFHRERTYFPRVALVQLAWPGGIVLVDALAVDLAPLSKVLAGPGTAVMHAAAQDLEVLLQECGAVPSALFDTQLAAGFVGMSTPSLAALVEQMLGVRLPKGDRLTDWLRRPLGPDQQDYAAADVAHLLALRDRLVDELGACGRLEWALAECEEARTRDYGPRPPEDAWLRIKEARALRGSSRGVAQALAAWRERRAAAIDQPVRFVLPDLALVAIAQRPPRTLDQLRTVRGIEDRQVRGPLGREILAAVEAGLALRPDQLREPRLVDAGRELRPAVTLVSAWVSQLARTLRLDTALLATRADIEALLRGDADARLATGWRAQLAGEPIRRLVAGDAAVAFDGHGGLLLERRSHLPL
ncbi:MAG TPA: HRDC domain-containing protein [Acidimicrobiales bacterium]